MYRYMKGDGERTYTLRVLLRLRITCLPSYNSSILILQRLFPFPSLFSLYIIRIYICLFFRYIPAKAINIHDPRQCNTNNIRYFSSTRLLSLLFFFVLFKVIRARRFVHFFFFHERLQ